MQVKKVIKRHHFLLNWTLGTRQVMINTGHDDLHDEHDNNSSFPEVMMQSALHPRKESRELLILELMLSVLSSQGLRENFNLIHDSFKVVGVDILLSG